MNTHPEFTQANRNRLLWGFMAVSAVICGLASWGVYRQSKDADELSANVTGGDSFPIVIPESAGLVIPLAIQNNGKSILSGVSVTVRNGTNLARMPPTTIEVGTLSPGDSSFRDIPITITPLIDEKSQLFEGEQVDIFLAMIHAQNGVYEEELMFKKGKCFPWIYKVWLDKWPNFMSNGEESKRLIFHDWIAEPEPPKCVWGKSNVTR